MAKLYAELTSDKGGRVASKGGDKFILTHFHIKNERLFTIRVHSDGNVDMSKGDGSFMTTYSPHELKS